MTAAAAASAASVPSSNANHSGDVHPAGSVSSVGSPPSHLGLRQLGSELGKPVFFLPYRGVELNGGPSVILTLV